MAEQRLVDVNNLGVGKANPDAFERKDYAHGWNNALQAVIDAAPTIDPETLPIVRRLREELAKVTAERDALLKELAEECGLCANYEKCKKYPAYCINGKMWEWYGLQKEEQHERG